MVQFANPEGPKWDLADVLAQELVDLAATPKEAVGDVIATVAGYFVRLCGAFDVDPQPLLRGVAEVRARRSDERERE